MLEETNRFTAIKRFLDANESFPDFPHWFYAGVTNHDEGVSFCLDCIKAVLPNAEICEHYGGGYCCESDGREHCEKCGKLLQYTLTDYGVENEMQHFVDEPLTASDLDADTCYELGRIAYGISTKQQARKFTALFKGMRLKMPKV